jgi:hypothetical protein
VANKPKSVYCIDAGNATTKAFHVGRKDVFIAPSCSKSISNRERKIEGTPESPIVSYQNGNKTDCFLIGKLAEERLGVYNFATSQKLDRIHRFLYGSIPADLTDLHVDRLIVSVPDSSLNGINESVAALIGSHAYTCNGIDKQIAIASATAIDETYAAYLGCIATNYFIDPSRLNGIITIGGGTVNLAIYDSAGNSISEYGCIVPKGLRSLALRISSALQSETDHTINASFIMSALGRGQTTASRVDFGFCLQECIDDWVADIRSTIQEKWTSMASEIGEVAIVGAPAPLLTNYCASTKNRFKIPTNPATFGLIGSQYIA